MEDEHWRRVRAALESLLGAGPEARAGELRRIAGEDEALAGELAELMRLEERRDEEDGRLEPPEGERLDWLGR